MWAKRIGNKKHGAGEPHFGGIPASIIALVISLASLLISSVQSYFAFDALNLGRKSLAMERKVDVCFDYLSQAQALNKDLANPVTMMFAAIRTNETDHPHLGDKAKLLGLGVLNSPFYDRVDKLKSIGLKASLLLPVNLSNEMNTYAGLLNNTLEDFFAPALDDAALAKQERPIDHSRLDASYDKIQKLCGSLIEKEAI